MSNLATVIMAAGKGTRMKSDLPKVLHKINGRPLVHYVIDLAVKLHSEKTILIIGHEKEMVKIACKDLNVEFASQDQQLGTGHAVQMTEPQLGAYDGDVLVLSGDVPLLTQETIKTLIDEHKKSSATATLLTSELEDPTGYGRIIRDANGFVKKIVEHKDANEEELKIKEINVGIYIFDAKNLFAALKNVKNDNIVITMEDNAGGIKEENLEKIFDPYFTTKHSSCGTGLGLFMSKMICEQGFNGTIDIKNKNNGILLSIKIPIEREKNG